MPALAQSKQQAREFRPAAEPEQQYLMLQEQSAVSQSS